MRPLQQLFNPCFAAAIALVLAACGGEKSPPSGPATEEPAVATITGEVFYRERIMLPPGFDLEVQLQDISRADAPASVMATVMSQPGGAPPWPFSITYDAAEIEDRRRYALRATVSRDGQLLFTSTEYIDPFAAGPLKVLVQRVAEPVAREPAGQAEAKPAPVEEGTIWLLDTLQGEPAPRGAQGRFIDLVLNQAEQTASGFGGCNRYTGGFSSQGRSAHGTPIAFGELASTMMACVEGGDAEQAYLEMLGSVDAYRMEGDQLALLSGETVVATFKLQ